MLHLQHHHPVSDLSVMVHDDGRVAYAFLLRGEEIVADVWLYNHGPAPSEPEWHDPEGVPYRNPAGYASGEEFAPASSEYEVRVEWWTRGDAEGADVYVRDRLIASLEAGSRPGASALAVADGPLARVMAAGD